MTLIPRLAVPLRRIALAAVAPLALYAAAHSEAHDWTSPPAGAGPATRPEPEVFQPLWAGPSSGRPAAPAARDCHRAPQPLALRDAGAPAFAPYGGPARERASPLAKSAAPAARAEADARAGASADAAESVAPAAPPALGSVAPQQHGRAPRPRDEPVAAGVVDDNADFGEFLAYRARSTHLPVRPRDVSERYLLTVHDAAGRPVPDAEVSLHGGALPLWARTDAGGQVWLHPRVVTGSAPAQDTYPPAPAVMEVQVHKAGARGSALLRRGQRDALQVRLDARAPFERARLDLVFLVDATGSMADEIDKLKRSMRSMAEQIARLPSRPDLCFALVAYRDRGDAFFVRGADFSDDLDAFQRELGALRAGGGGDYPEALNEALHTTIHRLSWRGDGATRLVVLVADAPPHLDYGGPFYDDDMQGALARGIKLFAVGASGLDPVGEYVFRQAAQYTGGRFVFLTYARAGDPTSGPGRETAHDVGGYSVESLDRLVVRLVREELARRPG